MLYIGWHFLRSESSRFALLCFNQVKAYHVTKILNLGSGYGRDTSFLGSKGIEVEALNYSVIAVEILTNSKRKKTNNKIKDL